MAKGKHDEAFNRETERMLKLGRANVDYIRKAKNWCKHFRIEMISGGLLAQTSGLPIGMHKVSCQFASGIHQSMNLPIIIPEFIVNNCKGCQYHQPNGDITWGKKIIEEANQNELLQIQNQQLREKQLEALRNELQTLSRQAKQTTKLTEHQILTFLEKIFSDNENESQEYSQRLVQSAIIGAELFPPIAINILIAQSLSIEFSSLCLPVCVELAGRRDDLTHELKKLAYQVIEKSISPELAALILLKTASSSDFPLPEQIISNLIGFQNHNRFLAHIGNNIHDYSNSNKLLLKSYDANPTSIINSLKELLKIDDKYIRINTCGVIEELQENRPELGVELLPDIVLSLELQDDPYEDSADAAAKQCIAKTFLHDPKQVDTYLISQLFQKRSAVQEEIVSVYGNLLWDIEQENNVNAISCAIERCLELAKDERLDIDLRIEAAEALERASSKNLIINAPNFFNNLLGFYALICEQEVPPKIVHIILPSQVQHDQTLDNLDEYNRQQTWGRFKDEIFKSLKSITNHIPEAIGPDVIKYFETVNIKSNPTLKPAIVDLLGELGKDYIFRLHVLPLLMKALMDFESQVMRAHGIQAIENIYNNAENTPPRNIIDILVLHLRDTYVIVHKSAIRIISHHRQWLTPDQTVETLMILLSWLGAYKSDPYYLRGFCT